MQVSQCERLDINTWFEKLGFVKDTLLCKKALLTHRVPQKPSGSGGLSPVGGPVSGKVVLSNASGLGT